MKKSLRSKNKAVNPKIDPYLEGLIGKLVERFVSLEKKMNIVITQTAGNSKTNRDTSKPFGSFEIKQSPRRDRVLYEAICADCHKVCEVPFKPSEDRPVYCKECFAGRKSLPAGRQAGTLGNGLPFLTPVALSPKPLSKLNVLAATIPPMLEDPKKAKKNLLAKKAKKKK